MQPLAQFMPDRNNEADTFDLAPVSLWLEDYSGLKRLFAQWRAAGVTDLRAYLLDDFARVRACSEQLKVLKVNRATLTLFAARDLPPATPISPRRRPP